MSIRIPESSWLNKAIQRAYAPKQEPTLHVSNGFFDPPSLPGKRVDLSDLEDIPTMRALGRILRRG